MRDGTKFGSPQTQPFMWQRVSAGEYLCTALRYRPLGIRLRVHSSGSAWHWRVFFPAKRPGFACIAEGWTPTLREGKACAQAIASRSVDSPRATVVRDLQEWGTDEAAVILDYLEEVTGCR